MDSPGAKQRVRKSAAVAVAFCALGCGIFHLGRPARSGSLAFRSYPRSASTSAEDAAPWLPLNADDEINRFPDLGVGVGEDRLRMIAYDQIDEAA